MSNVKLSSVIAPSFLDVHKDIKQELHTHYWLGGGRGSTKSSFISIEIILGMMKDEKANAVCFRKVRDTLRDSVFEQLQWAIKILNVEDYWKATYSPLKLIYKPTGQQIIFRGAKEPKRVKSVKLSEGYFKYLWYEELDEFFGMEEIRTINQTFMRGGSKFVVFYSFNPPKSKMNWVNAEGLIPRSDRLVHHSDYRTVPKNWLGEPFFIEAEHLKKTKPVKYDHEYLGEPTGTGGEVFDNVTLRAITDEEIGRFDRLFNGIDWGYASDPFHFARTHYDKTRRKLYIFNEIHQVKLSNRLAAEKIKPLIRINEFITADSAEPKSIDDLRADSLKVLSAKKGPGSVEHGMKWLEDLEEIIIDSERCPNTAREFTNYELDRDKEGNFIARYPDKNNHSIDATRYALESEMRKENKRRNYSGKGARR